MCELLSRSLALAQDAVNVLAVAKTDDPMIKLDEALAVIEGFKPTQVSYHDGELRAEFTPTRAAGDTQIVALCVGTFTSMASAQVSELSNAKSATSRSLAICTRRSISRKSMKQRCGNACEATCLAVAPGRPSGRSRVNLKPKS